MLVIALPCNCSKDARAEALISKVSFLQFFRFQVSLDGRNFIKKSITGGDGRKSNAIKHPHANRFTTCLIKMCVSERNSNENSIGVTWPLQFVDEREIWSH